MPLKRNMALVLVLASGTLPYLADARSEARSGAVLELKGFLREDQLFGRAGYVRIKTMDRCKKAVDGYVTERPILSDSQFRFDQASVAVTNPDTPQELVRVVIPVTEEGGKILEAWTGQNVGRGLALLFHGAVVWVPTISDRFAGPIILQGCYTRADADRIVSELKAVA